MTTITKHKFYLPLSRSVRTSRGMGKTKELRRFLLYSLYAWGVPTLLTVLTLFVDYWHLVPDIWSPQMGSKNVCWFGRELFVRSSDSIDSLIENMVFIRRKLAWSFHIFFISDWTTHPYECYSVRSYCDSL